LENCVGGISSHWWHKIGHIFQQKEYIEKNHENENYAKCIEYLAATLFLDIFPLLILSSKRGAKPGIERFGIHIYVYRTITSLTRAQNDRD
jgi:hypothetical protein